MKQTDNGGSGIGVVSVVQIILIILKLTRLIDWEWRWILAPTWVSIIFWLVFILIISIIFKRK